MEDSTKSEESTWPRTCDRFVAFLDIMGFKDMLMRKTGDEIYNMMDGIHSVVSLDNTAIAPFHKMSADEMMSTSGAMSALIFTNGGEIKGTTFHSSINTTSDEVLVKSNRVRSAMISDSIILYTKDTSPESRKLIEMSLAAIQTYMYENSIPFKGALARGEMTADETKSIYFGQPLTDAYLLEEELHFYGIVLHGSAQGEAELIPIVRNVVEVECSFKNGKSVHHAIIPSMATFMIKEQADKISVGLEKMRISTSGHLRRYIDNTEQFLTGACNFIDAQQKEMLAEAERLASQRNK